MKVSVTITVELADPEEWTTAFGIEGAREIRQDVKAYIANELMTLGVFGNGEVTATMAWR